MSKRLYGFLVILFSDLMWLINDLEFLEKKPKILLECHGQMSRTKPHSFIKDQKTPQIQIMWVQFIYLYFKGQMFLYYSIVNEKLTYFILCFSFLVPGMLPQGGVLGCRSNSLQVFPSLTLLTFWSIYKICLFFQPTSEEVE